MKDNKYKNPLFRMRFRLATAAALLLVCSVGIFGITQLFQSSITVSASASDLMEGISRNRVSGRAADDEFITGMADFSIELFKRSQTDKENSLISPLSVMLALAMTANGAGNDTLTQMEALLGSGIKMDELNKYLFRYARSLPNQEKSKFTIANSIWFRDNNGMKVIPEFLQMNADYYGASAYGAPFDRQTVRDINNWVDKNTNGMIKEIIDEIAPNNMLFLINAIMFDAEWHQIYYEIDVRKRDFTDINGIISNIDFMYGSEYLYLEDGMATGFLKPYAGGAYSFAALLPNEEASVETYIGQLTGESFLDVINSAQIGLVITAMPKFEYEYEISMIGALKEMGITDAFDDTKADFSRMADMPVFISEVLHKTFISVDERGTKAGAVTIVSGDAGGAMPEPKYVLLDRPFVYAIIDNATNLPIFIGTLMTVQ